ncbi:hypothetical protein SAMN05444338_11077 [Flavobacterium degerlachei]|uniref:Uncharacterized protein n=1 Tax=Flavobacterium degerlachei TaxID=229203 RepID=A0A1H3BPH2_9FLAO|nr:hypothetical protein SAMN05444338_11077 [Flavobacterium degerlachei]
MILSHSKTVKNVNLFKSYATLVLLIIMIFALYIILITKL